MSPRPAEHNPIVRRALLAGGGARGADEAGVLSVLAPELER
jgi:hypothetical protein